MECVTPEVITLLWLLAWGWHDPNRVYIVNLGSAKRLLDAEIESEAHILRCGERALRHDDDPARQDIRWRGGPRPSVPVGSAHQDTLAT